MRNDKERAIWLRRSGKSYNFIVSSLGVPKSTLSDWFSRLNWSQYIKQQLTREAFDKVQPKLARMAESNKKRWKLWRRQAQIEANKEFARYKHDLLFCAGVMIYWGEGDKNPKNPVRISNIDSKLLKIFVRFLRTYGNIAPDKIRAHLILYPDLDELLCKKYWAPRMTIRQKFFYKTQWIIGRHKTKRVNHGIGVVTVGSRQLKEKILKWIELYSKFNYAGII